MAAAKRKGKAMAKRSTTPERRTSSLSRILQARWRLLLALLFGAAVASLLPGDLRLVGRLLIGWDAGIALYIVLVLLMIAGADTGHMRRESARQEEGRIVIQVLTVTAGPAGLGAIVGRLDNALEAVQHLVCGGAHRLIRVNDQYAAAN